MPREAMFLETDCEAAADEAVAAAQDFAGDAPDRERVFLERVIEKLRERVKELG